MFQVPCSIKSIITFLMTQTDLANNTTMCGQLVCNLKFISNLEIQCVSVI